MNLISSYHSLTDGQIEVVNRILGNILSILFSEHPKLWDHVLAQEEFAFSDSPNKRKSLSPFCIMYGIHPRVVYELRNSVKEEMRSVEGEYFDTTMQELDE